MSSCLEEYSMLWNFCIGVAVVAGFASGAYITHLWHRAD